MNNLKNKLTLFSSLLIVLLLLVFSVTQSKNGLNFSILGYEALAQGFTTITCYEWGVQHGYSCTGSNGCWDGINEIDSSNCALECNDTTFILCPMDDE